MAELKKHSKEWNAAAFEGVDVPDYIRVVAAKIATVYGIGGQSDPGWIANMIRSYVTEQPTVCSVTTTGEHSNWGDTDFCIWCHKAKH